MRHGEEASRARRRRRHFGTAVGVALDDEGAVPLADGCRARRIDAEREVDPEVYLFRHLLTF